MKKFIIFISFITSISLASGKGMNDDQEKGACIGAWMFQVYNGQNKNAALRSLSKYKAKFGYDEKFSNFKKGMDHCLKAYPENDRLVESCARSTINQSDFDFISVSMRTFGNLKAVGSAQGSTQAETHAEMMGFAYCPLDK